MSRITEQDLLQRLDQYHKETIEFADKFASATLVLKQAQTVAEDSTKKFWVVYRAPIASTIIIAALALATLGVIFGMHNADMCLVDIGQKEISISVQSCKSHSD